MTKVDIISGFLGAGKTTFIKELISKVYSGEKMVLIENEFGEIGVDSRFMQDAGIEVTEMNSGCICCTLVGDFARALKQVVDTYHPDRIIIEPSGVGKLSDVAKAVSDMQEDAQIEVDSLITVVDGKKAKMYMKNFGEFFDNQIEYANTIVLSRTQMMDEAKLKECIELLREKNEEAAIVTTEWDKLSGDMIKAALEQGHDLKKEMMELISHMHHEHHDHDHDHHHHHHHADEVFTSWGIETPNTYSAEDIEKILTALDSGEYGAILRAKGMVPAPDGTWVYYDYVPEEHDIRSGKPEVTGKICVIGSKLDEDKLAELFRK